MAEKTVLLIEDNVLNRKLVRDLLRVNKCRIIEADNANTGIEMAKAHRPDIILMDLQLPGLDGMSAAKIIKEEPDLKDIPIIAITAHAMQGDEERILDGGCDAYISKPIDTRNFWKNISGFLDSENREIASHRRERHGYRNKILIVDDEPLNVKLLAAKISGHKYTVLTAYSGKEALKKAASENPDVILMDIMMPGMDGYEVTSRLKNDTATMDIPIIMVTALDGVEDKIKGFEFGAEEFLTKPVNTAELLTRITSMLRLKQYKEQVESRFASQRSIDQSAMTASTLKKVERESHILLIEDSDKEAKLIMNHIQGDPYRVTWLKKGAEAMEFAMNEEIDLVLLDILLPDADGFDLCRRFKEMDQTRCAQIVIVTCLRDLESKIKGIELGADDYLVKPINAHELKARIRVLLKKKKYVDTLHSGYQAALDSATIDGLTGLYNHKYLKRYLAIEKNRSRRYDYPIALCMIDIDDFKQCNDTYGHVVGDELLRELSRIIKKSIRETDMAARYGGEEFVVVLPYADSGDSLMVAERIRTAIHEYSFQEKIPKFQGKVSVSIGVATYPLDSSDHEDLIKKADQMLYKAKSEGKNRLCIFNRHQKN